MSVVKNKFTGLINNNKQCIIELFFVMNQDNRIAKARVFAMIDTGSYYSHITKLMADNLGLKYTGQENKSQAFGSKEMTQKEVNTFIQLPNININFDVLLNVSEELEIFTGISMILGTNILDNFIFKYNEPIGKFSLELRPSANNK